jgi:hypothetical protein
LFECQVSYSPQCSVAINLLAKKEGNCAKEMCVILTVDGLQKLDHTPGSRDSPLYQVISVVQTMVNCSECFLIVACSATVYETPNRFFADSPQLRVDIVPPSIDPNSAFLEYKDDLIVKLLVDDMGGHARALEVLEQYYQGDTSDVAFLTLAGHIATLIGVKYPALCRALKSLEPVLKCVIPRACVRRNDVIGGMSLDEIVSLGLF